MDIRPAFRAALLADPDVVALAGTRISSVLGPQGKSPGPRIVFIRVSEIEAPTLKGRQGLVESRVQVDCWAELHDDAAALAEAVWRRMQGLSGEFMGIVFCGVWAMRIQEDQDSATAEWRVRRDYLVRHRAA
jgi:hypothetical protein